MRRLGSTRRRKRASGRTEYNTPQCVLDCIARLGRIACDPCWNRRSKVKARVRYTEKQNGLTQSWPRRGITYVNPPYGAALRLWVPKFLAEDDRGVEMVVLVPNSTETVWFTVMLRYCAAAVCWRGRLTFDGCKDAAFFGSVLFYFGHRPHAFVQAFRPEAYPIKCEIREAA